LVIEDTQEKLASKAKSEGTWNNINLHSSKYEEFCLTYSLDIYPASPDNLAHFVTHLFLEDKSYSTIKNYLSSVNTAQQMDGWPAIAPSIKVKLTLAGVKKLTALQTKQARPITPIMLKRMASKVDPSSSEQLAAWAAIVVGFHLLLRKSNLVPNTTNSYSQWRDLSRGSFRQSANMLLVKYSWSKTNQYGKQTIVPLAPNNTMACPVFVMETLAKAAPAPAHKHAFSYMDKQGGLRPLTYNQLQFWLKRWVRQIGLNERFYSTHSLRRGGATEAFRSNLPPTAIKMLGDWASECFQEYIKVSLNDRIKTARYLAELF